MSYDVLVTKINKRTTRIKILNSSPIKIKVPHLTASPVINYVSLAQVANISLNIFSQIQVTSNNPLYS